MQQMFACLPPEAMDARSAMSRGKPRRTAPKHRPKDMAIPYHWASAHQAISYRAKGALLGNRQNQPQLPGAIYIVG